VRAAWPTRFHGRRADGAGLIARGVWAIAWRRYDAGLLIGLGFFVVGVLAVNDYGQTWDEPETYDAALLNIRVVKAVMTGQPRPRWGFHELPGYGFIVDLLRGAFAWAVSIRLHLIDDVVAHHLFNLLLSAVSVVLFYRLALHVSGRWRIAVLATTTLALFPQFLAHAQNNPKDLPGLFVYVLVVYTFTRLGAASMRRDVLYAGLALGLALSTHITAVLLFPVLGLWLVLTERTRLRAMWRSYVVVVAVGGGTAFLGWPWLWNHPIQKLGWVASHVRAFRKEGLDGVLYLGTIYRPWELPWRYSIVIFLATTPVLYLLFAVVSLGRVRFGGGRTAGNPGSAATLGLVWCAILIAAETRAPLRYDGTRHLLMMVPGFCLLAGVGLDAIVGWIESAPGVRRARSAQRVVAAACAAAAFVYVGVEMRRIHPYQNAYLNEVTNAWLAGNAEDVFEVEYWQQSYKEGAQWLNAHAGPDAEIYVAFGETCANHYLDRKSTEFDEDRLALFEGGTRVAYVMAITRRALYQEPMRRVARAYEPVFTVHRQKGTLLKIYSNRRRTADGAVWREGIHERAR
jgi:Dolichyl-phosphate-mannose-protein mannosyltransferase